jgi:hypothetical protein
MESLVRGHRRLFLTPWVPLLVPSFSLTDSNVWCCFLALICYLTLIHSKTWCWFASVRLYYASEVLNTIVWNFDIARRLRYSFTGLYFLFPSLPDSWYFFIWRFLHEMDMAYAATDVVVSRAGSVACTEILVTGKPAILVSHITSSYLLCNSICFQHAYCYSLSELRK